jgi:hypothetical protein
MSQSLEYGADATIDNARRDEHDLCRRVQAEFREMPGLTLTLPQASRLFSIERASCERILGALVRAGHLSTAGEVFASWRGGRRSADSRSLNELRWSLSSPAIPPTVAPNVDRPGRG